MEREIKFRGLRADGNGWVYGDLVRDKHLNGVDILFFILTEEAKTFDDVIPVIPESVGQFTGLYDKNGVDIYEGDKFAPDTYNDEVKSVVRWDYESAKFVVDSYGYDFHIGEGSQEVYDNELSICDTADLGDMILEYCEVTGNIHE